MKSNTNDLATFFPASWDAWRAVREGKQGISQRQQERLRALVFYARRHSRYIADVYRDVPEQLTDVRQLPVMTKEESKAMNSTIHNETLALLEQGQQAHPVVITEAHLSGLPEVVQRYLRYSQVVGKEIPHTVRLKQIGKFRQSAQQPWMNLDAKQYYSVNPPGFLWVGTIRKGGLPLVRARDRYWNGKGNMQIKLGTLFTIANATGEEMDQSAMMRYLNEMIWFPTAFLGKNISFEPVDNTSARVTLTDKGKSVSGTMFFDDEGKFIDFVAPRYREINGRYELDTWSTPLTEYGEYEGLKLPVKGKAVWKLKEGDLEYIDVVITDLAYNIPKPY